VTWLKLARIGDGVCSAPCKQCRQSAPPLTGKKRCMAFILVAFGFLVKIRRDRLAAVVGWRLKMRAGEIVNADLSRFCPDAMRKSDV